MLYALLSTLMWVINTVIDLYIYVIIAAVIVSWLIAFEVINMRNNLARSIVNALFALTEPVFRQVRRVIPPIGGLDLSPLVVLIALYAIQRFLNLAYFSYQGPSV